MHWYAVVSLFLTCAVATRFYASPNGGYVVDPDSGQALATVTLQGALDVVQAGDDILLFPGVFSATGMTILPFSCECLFKNSYRLVSFTINQTKGTQDSPVVLRGRGASTIIDGNQPYDPERSV